MENVGKLGAQMLHLRAKMHFVPATSTAPNPAKRRPSRLSHKRGLYPLGVSFMEHPLPYERIEPLLTKFGSSVVSVGEIPA